MSCGCVLAVSAGSLPTPPSVRSLPRPPGWTSRHALHAEFAWMRDVGAWLLRRVSSKTRLPGLVDLVSHLSVSDRCETYNLRQDLFDASERSAAGGDSNPFGNGAPIQWAGPKGRLPPHPS